MNQPNTAIIFTQRYAIKINRVVGQQSHIHANVWRLLPPQGSLLEISLSKPCSPLFCSTIHDYSNEQRINITLVGSVRNTLWNPCFPNNPKESGRTTRNNGTVFAHIGRQQRHHSTELKSFRRAWWGGNSWHCSTRSRVNPRQIFGYMQLNHIYFRKFN